MAGTKIQMIGIGQDYLGINRQQVFGRHGLDSGIGTDRHKDRGLNTAMERFQRTETCLTRGILMDYSKIIRHAASHTISMASP